ncbi:hypothetical protein GCM10027168_44980 [Streptomyces capparidis]
MAVIAGAAVGGAAVAGVLLVVFTPVIRSLVAWISGPDWEGMDEASRATAVGQFRLAVVQVGAALGAGVAVVFTAFTYRLNRRGQTNERFVKALERLDSPSLHVRIGGILALQRIVADAPDYALDTARVLNEYIRQHTPRRPTASTASTPPGRSRVAAARRTAQRGAPPQIPTVTELPDAPAADVQHALTTLTGAAFRRPLLSGTPPTNLAHLHLHEAHLECAHLATAEMQNADLARARLVSANLAWARLSGANLTRADLRQASLPWADLVSADLTEAVLERADLHRVALERADLTRAYLVYADLTRANLEDADLTRAILLHAHLTRANLKDADMTQAYLQGAILTGADLEHADLTGARLKMTGLLDTQGLTWEQVVSAFPRRSTLLPPHIAAHPAVVARIAQIEAEYPEA